MIKLILVLFVTGTAFKQSEAAACQYWYTSQWSGGAIGNFVVSFPRSAQGWNVKVTYSANVNSLDVWNGQNSKCSGNVCTFSNADWNGAQRAGNSLTLGHRVNFPGSSPPQVLGITVNNQAICGSSSPNPTQAPPGPTKAPTQRPPSPTKAPTQPPPSGVGVTQAQFNNAVTSCGYQAPTSAQYTAFNSYLSGATITSRRELAMFLANIVHETGGLLQLREQYCQTNDCSVYGVAPNGAKYFGRGYMQLTWNYNYQAASLAIYGDTRYLNDPDMVARNEVDAWKTAYWYWSAAVHNAAGVTAGKFGASIKAINGALECNNPSGTALQQAQRRYYYYTKILVSFGVNETPIESGCYN